MIGLNVLQFLWAGNCLTINHLIIVLTRILTVYDYNKNGDYEVDYNVNGFMHCIDYEGVRKLIELPEIPKFDKTNKYKDFVRLSLAL